MQVLELMSGLVSRTLEDVWFSRMGEEWVG